MPSNSKRRARKWGQHSDPLQAASSSSPSTLLDQPGTVFVRLPEHHCLLLTADHSAVCPKVRHEVLMHGPALADHVTSHAVLGRGQPHPHAIAASASSRGEHGPCPFASTAYGQS